MKVSIILDLIIILIVAYQLFYGYKNGFVKTFLKFFVIIISLFTAYTISTYLSDIIYRNIVRPSFGDYITKEIVNYISNSSNDTILNNIFSFFNLNFYDIKNSISSSINDATSVVIDRVVYPIIIKFLNFFLTLIFYFIIKLILNLLIKKLDIINKVPFLGTINKAIGVIFGLCIGLIYSVLFTIFINFIIILKMNTIVTIEDVQNTHIFKNIYNINIFR